MRKPTREEVIRTLDAYKFYCVDTVAMKVMALFEDKPEVPQFLHCPKCGCVGSISPNPNKPIPKWEEEFGGLLNEHAYFCNGETEGTYSPIKDFIREKLRELREDCHPDRYRAGPVKEKWGL